MLRCNRSAAQETDAERGSPMCRVSTDLSLYSLSVRAWPNQGIKQQSVSGAGRRNNVLTMKLKSSMIVLRPTSRRKPKVSATEFEDLLCYEVCTDRDSASTMVPDCDHRQKSSQVPSKENTQMTASPPGTMWRSQGCKPCSSYTYNALNR